MFFSYVSNCYAFFPTVNQAMYKSICLKYFWKKGKLVNLNLISAGSSQIAQWLGLSAMAPGWISSRGTKTLQAKEHSPPKKFIIC